MSQQMASMNGPKVRAVITSLREDTSLWPAVLVALGALFLTSLFPFYPLWLCALLALVCGAVAYFHPPAGTFASLLLAFPSVAYQSPIFMWVYGFVVAAIALPDIMNNWKLISFLSIIICAPFAPFPLGLAGGFVQFGLSLAALYVGSRDSVYISIPSVIFILLLSTLWLAPNSAFLLTRDLPSVYGPASDVAMFAKDKGAPELMDLPSAAVGGLSQALSVQTVFHDIGPAFGKVVGNLVTLLNPFSDSALIQLAAWVAVLFAIAHLPVIVGGKHKQAIASLALLFIPLAHLAISFLYGVEFPWLILAYTALAIGAMFVIESRGIDLSRERLIQTQAKTKKFGKLGVEDMTNSEGPASLDAVGGYGDVKDELRESILAPLQRKELSEAYGIKPPAGILLFGPPGTGKTMLMRALSKELGIGFYYVKCSELLSEWYGESLPYSEKIAIMEDGKIFLVPIGEIVENKRKAKVLSFGKGGQAEFVPITGFIKHKCTSPIYEVRTRTGRRIRVTGYHSLFTLEGSEIRSIATEKLVPRKSHIAIPSRMAFSPSPVRTIDLLAHLRQDDYGLHVKNTRAYVSNAIGKLGVPGACRAAGIKRDAIAHILRKDAGMPAAKFIRLMERAGVAFDAKKIMLGVRGGRFPGEIPIEEDFAFFLGLWVAEGSYNRKDTVRISTSEKELAYIEGLCRKLFGHVTVYAKDAGKGGKGRDIYIGSRALYVLMHEVLGLNHGADSKKVPQIAFSFSPANLSAFLRGYFSGDGGIYENQKGVGTVEASTVSQELADQVLYLLLCFGIVGTAYEKAEKHGLPAVRICMTGEPLRRFAQHVRFMEGEKSLRLSRCLGIGQWHRARRIPFGGHLRDLVVPRLPDYGKCASIGANVLNDWSEESGNEGLSELCASDIHWDRVESVTRVQDEEFVYDIAVEPCQNFAGGFGGIYAHNSEKNVTELFSTAHKNAPCILFFDEIDSLAKRRDRQSNDDVGPRIMSTLLSEMDGFKVKNGKAVIVIGATNIPDQLDPAIMRPGRLDKIIYMHLPDKAAREAIFGVHLSKLPLSPDVDVKKLAASTERFSGADIANVVNEAVRLAAREASAKNEVVPISQKHLLSVLARIRPSTSLDSLSSYEQFRLDFERRSGAAPEEKKEGAVTFEDVVGLDDVRQALREAVDIPLLHPDLIKEYKIKPSRGLLLFGPPGCGKTMIVRAASHDLNATFLSLSGADLLKKGPANSERTLHEIFNRAREQAPALIFIDEIEALTPSRSQYASPVLTQILQEMDGLTELKNVMVVGATNKPSSLDSAILRPGRFDKILYIPPPDAKSRAALFAKNLAFLNPALDFAALSRSSEGFSGADIASVCQEAKMGMVRTRITDQTAGAGGSTPLTQDMLESILSQRRPSITDADLMEYERFKLEYGERR